MDYGSASEGEIVENEGDKATTTRPFGKNSLIDRKSRPRSPHSRSPRPLHLDGAYDDTTLDYGDGKTARNPHGQKRSHDDTFSVSHRGRNDPRQFQIRYDRESDQSRGHARDRDSRRYGDGDGRRDGRYTDRQAPDKRRRTDTRDDRYARDRSHDSSRQQDRNRNDRGQNQNRSRRSSTHSLADRESISASSRVEPGLAKLADTNSVGMTSSGKSEANIPESDGITALVDEAQLIEERRKRREALRAKHRDQGTPLLQKALQSSTASRLPDAETPNNDSGIPSGASTPVSSRYGSPRSPAAFSVVNDEELANPAQASPSSTTDSPAAADYDPNMDMQEAKLRENAAANNQEASAAEYDETQDKDRTVIVPATVDAQVAPVTKASRELDMFADDDEDDMFAPEPVAGAKKTDGTQAVRIPEAKQLDRSLLDDWDDPEGYYRIILGELLDGRYHIQTNLGKGVFSAVVRALDVTTDRVVAIKIIRTQESMYKAGIKEIEILQLLAEADPEDKKHLIRLERHFEHKGHLCMVFENLSINLREVLKKFGRDIGINIKAVRSYAQQMFLGLGLLKKCEILHADLKPDNVLVNENRSQLKIADLGSAMSANDNDVTDALVSRFYRAPEIMLGIKHDYAIDMWSIGCTLFEMYTGKICFTGPTNNQMLKAIMECRGKFPNRMLKRSEFWAQHFDPDGTFLSQEVDSVTRREMVRRMNITRTLPAKELKARLFANAKGLSPADAKELNLFADLLDKCLALDPTRRITPAEALRHGFISRSIMPIPK